MTESVASMHCSLLSKPQEGGRPTGAYREAGRQASMGPAACRQAGRGLGGAREAEWT